MRTESPIRTALFRRFSDRMVAAERGRQHILNQAAYAEDSDEGQVFDFLLERIDDPTLHKMVKIHQADEKRHAGLFREALARNGSAPYAVPSSLALLERLDEALGGFFENLLDRDHPVMEAYLLLQVIEERAVNQFTEMRPAFARHDPQTAALLDEISADEERHLKYCIAIARRYAPDDETAAKTLARFREVEAVVFADLMAANMKHVLENDIPKMSRIENRLWRGVLALMARLSSPLPTSSASRPPANPAVAAA